MQTPVVFQPDTKTKSLPQHARSNRAAPALPPEREWAFTAVTLPAFVQQELVPTWRLLGVKAGRVTAQRCASRPRAGAARLTARSCVTHARALVLISAERDQDGTCHMRPCQEHVG